MYCSTKWYNCTVTAMRRLRIAYNNSLRRLLGIPKHNSASGMFVQLNIESFSELLRSYIHSFMNRLHSSNDLTLSSICESTVPICILIFGRGGMICYTVSCHILLVSILL